MQYTNGKTKNNQEFASGIAFAALTEHRKILFVFDTICEYLTRKILTTQRGILQIMANNTDKTQSNAAQGGGKTGGNQTDSTTTATDIKNTVGDAVSGATDTIKDALGQAKETGGAVASQAYGIAAKKATEAIDEK